MKKQDITITIKNQTINSKKILSSIYGTNYIETKNGIELTKKELDLYFKPDYRLTTQIQNNTTSIVFISTLKDSSTYNVSKINNATLTIKRNLTNLIITSMSIGLIFLEIIIFIICIFKLKSKN